MDAVIEHLPAGVREKLDRKARASGRTIEAEAAAILSETLGGDNLEIQLTPPEGMDGVQRMVWEAYGGKLPGNAVDEFLAERKRMWGESG